MPTYQYYGRDNNGSAIKGSVERGSENDVLSFLSKKHIIPIKIELVTEKQSVTQWFNKLAFTQDSVADEQLIMFCRQMYTINKSGLPLIQGLESLSASIRPGALQSCLLDVIDRLESGLSLSQSMQYHKNIFNNLFIGMVKVGENTGHLEDVFLQMATYIQRDMETKKAVKTALRYPSFVLVAMVIALFVVNLLVIPAFADMFSRFSAELPLPTKILLGTSHFFIHYWWLVVILVFGAIYSFVSWANTSNGKVNWHRYKLSIPIIGPLINKAAIARYVRSFSLMLGAGVPMHKAIQLCSEIIDNHYLAQKIRSIRSEIEKGDSVYRTHDRSGLFTPLVLQMISIGENTGKIDTLLIDVAEFYEGEVDYDLQSLSAKIEPLLIVIMAVFVMVLALGVFLPLWEMFNIQR